MNKEIINVKKRNGRGEEKLDIDKIHSMVEYAVEDIKGVSASQIEMNSGLQFYEGMSTDEIQQILIKSAAESGADAAKFQNFRAETIVSDYGFKSLKNKHVLKNNYKHKKK